MVAMVRRPTSSMAASPYEPRSWPADELASLSPNAIGVRPSLERHLELTDLIPDSPDELAFCRRPVPIFAGRSVSYAEPGGRGLTDATGERRNRRFRQRSCGFRARRPNPNRESGFMRSGGWRR